MDDWLVWLIVGVACLALETLTLSFVVSYFGVGALAASAAALLGAPVGGQVASSPPSRWCCSCSRGG